MTKIKRLLLPILLILPIIDAYADIYRCKDSTGRLITSDRAMAECADKATQVYTNSGALKDQLPGALTPEQKRAAELQEQQRNLEAMEQENERKEQRYLLAHYPTEQDVQIARQQALAAIDTKIASERRVITVSAEALKANQNEQANLPKNQTDKLNEAKNKEEDLKLTILQANRNIERYIAQRAATNRRFDETHKRYLEIVGSGKKTTAEPAKEK